LELRGRDLVAKPEVIAVSKAELTGSENVRRRLEQELGRPVIAVSAVTGQGLAQLVAAVVDELTKVRESELATAEPIAVTPAHEARP
jgi:GTP-binding protein